LLVSFCTVFYEALYSGTKILKSHYSLVILHVIPHFMGFGGLITKLLELVNASRSIWAMCKKGAPCHLVTRTHKINRPG